MLYLYCRTYNQYCSGSADGNLSVLGPLWKVSACRFTGRSQRSGTGPRHTRFKLTNGGELFDLSEAPYKEIAVASTTTDPAAIAARERLQEVLKEHPAAPGGPGKKAAKAGKKKNRKKN
jgi:hypothetical protein